MKTYKTIQDVEGFGEEGSTRTVPDNVISMEYVSGNVEVKTINFVNHPYIIQIES